MRKKLFIFLISFNILFFLIISSIGIYFLLHNYTIKIEDKHILEPINEYSVSDDELLFKGTVEYKGSIMYINIKVDNLTDDTLQSILGV